MFVRLPYAALGLSVFASKDKIRRNLTGVCVTLELGTDKGINKPQWRCRAEAMNGHHACRIEWLVGEAFFGEALKLEGTRHQVIVPAETIAAAAKLTKPDNLITLDLSNPSLSVRRLGCNPHGLFPFTPVDESFPEVDHVMDLKVQPKPQAVLGFNPEYVATYAKFREKFCGVTLSFWMQCGKSEFDPFLSTDWIFPQTKEPETYFGTCRVVWALMPMKL